MGVYWRHYAHMRLVPQSCALANISPAYRIKEKKQFGLISILYGRVHEMIILIASAVTH